MLPWISKKHVIWTIKGIICITNEDLPIAEGILTATGFADKIILFNTLQSVLNYLSIRPVYLKPDAIFTDLERPVKNASDFLQAIIYNPSFIKLRNADTKCDCFQPPVFELGPLLDLLSGFKKCCLGIPLLQFSEGNILNRLFACQLWSAIHFSHL